MLLHHVLLSVPQEGLTIKAETCSTLAYKHFPNIAVIDGPIINFFYIVYHKQKIVVYLMTPSVNQNIRIRSEMKADSD